MVLFCEASMNLSAVLGVLSMNSRMKHTAAISLFIVSYYYCYYYFLGGRSHVLSKVKIDK